MEDSWLQQVDWSQMERQATEKREEREEGHGKREDGVERDCIPNELQDNVKRVREDSEDWEGQVDWDALETRWLEKLQERKQEERNNKDQQQSTHPSPLPLARGQGHDQVASRNLKQTHTSQVHIDNKTKDSRDHKHKAEKRPALERVEDINDDRFFQQVEMLVQAVSSASVSKEECYRLVHFVQSVTPKLKKYQRQGVTRMLERNCRAFLYDEMGLGKTLQALFCALVFGFSKHTWPILITCPASLRMSWRGELEKWAPFLLPPEVFVVKNSRASIPTDCKIVICSYRMLDLVRDSVQSLRPRFLIADEVHKTRSHDSKLSLALSHIASSIPHVLLLTGTPMLIRPFEIFTQLDIMLSSQDKNMLIPGWGGVSGDQKKRSHLACCLFDPLSSLDDIAESLKLSNTSPYKTAIKTVQNVIEEKKEKKRTGQKVDVTVDEVWSSISSVQDLNSIMQLIVLFLLELHVLAESILSGTPESIRQDVLKQLKTAIIAGKSGRIDVLGARQLVAKTRSACFCLFNKSSTRHVGSQLSRAWNGHRFGLKFCRGEKKPSLRGNKGALCWDYSGCDRTKQKRLSQTLESYIIRRRKADVLGDLPEKQRNVFFVNLDAAAAESKAQRDKAPLRQVVSTVSSTNANAARRFVNAPSRIAAAPSDTVDLGGAKDDLKLLALRCEIASRQLTWELQKIGIAKAPFVAERVVDILTSVDEKEKLIVFAHHVKVLEIIHAHLLRKRGSNPEDPSFQKFNCAVLNGQVAVSERDRIVQSFQSDERYGPRVLLLSMMAMGTGFTLTRSSLVVMAELHWSPQILLQAEDRVHRVGQKDSVYVQYILAQHSLDTTLWSILAKRLSRMERTIVAQSPVRKPARKRRRGTGVGNTQSPTRPSSGESRQFSQVNIPTNTVQPEEPPLPNWYTTCEESIVKSKAVESFLREKLDASKLRFFVSETERVHLFLELCDADKGLWESMGGTVVDTTRKERAEETGSAGAGMGCAMAPLFENFLLGDFRTVVEDFVDKLNVQDLSFRDETGQIEDTESKWEEITIALPRTLKNPSSKAFSVTQAFVEEWFGFNLARRNRLMSLGVPLQVPLSTYLDITKRDASLHLTFDRTCNPAFQVHSAAISTLGSGNYRMAYVRFLQFNPQTKSKEYRCVQQAFDLHRGLPLCLFCGAFYSSIHRLECEGGTGANDTADANRQQLPTIQLETTIQSLFCGNGAPCYTSWALKCYRKTARIHLSESEMGVCASCKVDTRAMMYRVKAFQPGSSDRLRELFCEEEPDKGKLQVLCPHFHPSSFAHNVSQRTRIHWSPLQRVVFGEKWLAQIMNAENVTEGLFWEADHKLAVRLGGGQSTLDNFQTLCKPCHLAKTREDRSKMSKLRKKQKEHLAVLGRMTRNIAQNPDQQQLVCEWCRHVSDSIPSRINHDLICPEKPR